MNKEERNQCLIFGVMVKIRGNRARRKETLYCLPKSREQSIVVSEFIFHYRRLMFVRVHHLIVLLVRVHYLIVIRPALLTPIYMTHIVMKTSIHHRNNHSSKQEIVHLLRPLQEQGDSNFSQT